MSKNFNLKELCESSTAKAHGIDNTPSFSVCCNLEALIDNILQPLRDAYGKPIRVSSGYRCSKLNSMVGGASNSQHLYGMAADLTSVDGNRAETEKLFEMIIKLRLPFDQLIWEHDKYGTYWVHVSFKKGNNRNQVISNLLKK